MMKSNLVCHCFKISYSEVAAFIGNHPDTTLENIIEKTSAGGRCRACVAAPSIPNGKRDYYLQDLLAEIRQENLVPDKRKNRHRVAPFAQLPLYQKILRVEDVFQNDIRPYLKKDGGNVELMDIVEGEIFIQFHGACQSCPSSTGDTLGFIRETLLTQLGEKNITVSFWQ